MNTQPTPETDKFFATFADGEYAPSHAEYYARLQDLERERDEARFQLATAQADQENDTQAELAAWEMLEEVKRERDDWKAVAAQYSAEREHNAMKALSYEAERDELRRWKSEQMQVESTWDAQKVAKLLGMRCGIDIRANIQPCIEKLIADNTDLRRLLEKTRRQLELALDEIVKGSDSKQPTTERGV